MNQPGGTRIGVLTRLGRLFMDSLKGTERTVVGTDKFNNVYYVETPRTGNKSVLRGYVPGDTKRWKDVPVEWHAWLRNRRVHPPTDEEIEANEAKSALARMKAHELDEQNRKLREQDDATELNERKKFADSKFHVDPSKSYTGLDTRRVAFPKYGDYDSPSGFNEPRDDVSEKPA